MRNFLKNSLSSAFGIFIFCFFGLFSLIIILLGSGIWNKFSSEEINKNSILEIRLDEKIIENPIEIESDFLPWKTNIPLCLKDQINAIKRAKNDNRIRGISLKINMVDIGITQIKDFHTALNDFKKSGKFIYSYLNNASQKSYYLASISDKIFLNPTGMIEFFGLSSEVLFFKNFADKYGIKFNIIRNGEYKSAVEPFFRNSISKENKLQISENLHDIWSQISKEISDYRKIHIDSLNKNVSELSSIIPQLAIKNRLVDELIQEVDYDILLNKKLGFSNFEKFNIISMNEYHEKTSIETSFELNKIAVLYFSGVIMPGEDSYDIQSEFYKKIIRQIKEDKSIKALVLRINSPGGSANASDEILHELKLLKKKKPIVVSFSNIAASGGYYIAMQADSIFAYPTTITGSIGVVGIIPDFKQCVNNLGITSDIVQTHPNSYFYSLTYGLSKGGKKILIHSIKNFYNRFITLVSENRKKSFRNINSIARGRIWSGKKALKNGLIDKFGDLNRAVNSASKLAKIQSFSLESYPKTENSFQFFFERINKKFALHNAKKNILLKEEEYLLFKKIREIKNYSGVMMISPIEINF